MRYSMMLSWIVALVVPVALVGLALRVLLSPLFLQIEYNMPYFPPDDFGFTKADRLRWAPLALDYLLNSEDISYLADLQFEDGAPLYNERELRHMDDVKQVTRGALRAWYVSLGILVSLAGWAWLGGWWAEYSLGLMRGGWLMVALGVAVGLVVVAGLALNPDVFWNFFAGFHSLFFEGDSWLFHYSDTLIRLFPIRFWQDAFLWAAVLALGGGLALALGFKHN